MQRGEEGREIKGRDGIGWSKGEREKVQKACREKRDREGYGALRKHIVVHHHTTLAQSLGRESS